MKTAALAALLVAAAAPAALAQDRAAEIEFENHLRETQEKAAKAAAKAKAQGVVDTTIVAMRDAVGAGMAAVDYLESKQIKVVLREQAEAAKTAVEEGKTVIALSDKLPGYPRVYAPLIAEQAAKMIYADMPACAERAYMIRGTAGRSWIELGGNPKALPVVEELAKIQVPAVSAAMGAWATDAAQMALYKISQSENLPELPEMISAAKDDAERAKLEAANKRFVAFLLDESFARQSAGLR